MVVCGQEAARASQRGFLARAIALSGRASRQPTPSRISSTTGRTGAPERATRAAEDAGAVEAMDETWFGAGDPVAGDGARRGGMPITLSFYLFTTGLLTAMSFIQANWMLLLVMFLSGGMLLWPLVQRRMSPMKDIGNLGATQLVNTRNAVLLDVREPAEYGAGRLPKALNVPLSQIGSRAPELGKLTGRPVDRVLRARGAQPQRRRRAGEAGHHRRLQSRRRLPRLEGCGPSGGAMTWRRRSRCTRPRSARTASRPSACSRAKGVADITKLRVDLDPALRRTMMDRTGRRTVPQIYIGDTHVGGYDDLVALDRKGQLDGLLAGPP